MQNSDDNELELDDDLYDDSFDDDVAYDLDEFDDAGDGELTAIDDGELEPFDEDFDNQEWDDGSEDLPGAGQELEKKSLSFNTIVIIGAVVVGVIVFGVQVFSGGGNQGVGDKFASALNMSGATDGPIFGEVKVQKATQDNVVDSPAEEINEEAFLFNPDILDEMGSEMEEETPPMPTPMVQEDVAPVNDPELMNIPAPNVAEQPEAENDQIPRGPEEITAEEAPQITQEQDIPIIDPTAMLEESLAENSASSEDQDVENTTEPVLDLSELTMTQPENQTTNLEQDLAGQLEEQIENPDPVFVEAPQAEEQQNVVLNIEEPVEVQESPADTMTETISQTVTTNVDNQNYQLLETKLDMIVSRLDAMEDRIGQVQQSDNPSTSAMESEIAALKKEISRLASLKQTQTTSKPKSSSSPAKHVQPKAPAPTRWELRGAQPGKAWVSKKGQKSVQAVGVGDNLSGVGRITSISYKMDRWVVQGTMGQIRQ